MRTAVHVACTHTRLFDLQTLSVSCRSYNDVNHVGACISAQISMTSFSGIDLARDLLEVCSRFNINSGIVCCLIASYCVSRLFCQSFILSWYCWNFECQVAVRLAVSVLAHHVKEVQVCK